jgi:sigma-B regulation protein RsbU (phosphoserine phosphatase)
MKTFLDLAPCLYFSTTDDGTLIDVNETLCIQLGFTRDELPGRKVDLIFTIATRIFHQTHLFPLLKMQGYAEEIYITLQAKNKEQVPVIFNTERKLVDEGFVLLFVGIIVHNRKKYEDELIAAKKAAEIALQENTALIQAKQELQRNLEQLDKHIFLVDQQNEELRQFNHVVTHEMQEPLRKLFVFTNMFLENGEKRDHKTIIERIKRVSEQMHTIISGLQQYIWLTETPNKFVKVALDQLLSSVKQELEKEHPELTLILKTEDLIPVDVDQEQMHILFYQLLSNAIRFRKEDNAVYIKVSANNLLLNKFQNIDGKYEYIEFLKLQVEDNGTGFDAKYKDQVFGLFKRLHSVSGRGVGLALCKKIIDKHHGSITIDSKEGEGTTVTILLPVNQANKIL